jgi:CheY-like chemotaxis protein/predicted regulator of Ras-like GTPase activity (Roadblock/LC7/MglB family)
MSILQKRVLIVDDEEDLTWTLSKKLSKDSDKFQLVCVNSGKEAIEVMNQLPVDLVITDVRMPEVSGLELLVQIKERYPQTKVILMTAYGSDDVRKEAGKRGCFRYIEKPFEINDLRSVILDALTEDKGFKGSVADFQLSDIIQLNCLGRLTSALEVKHEHESGLIYFDNGNIVHAETGHLTGENAFYHIMAWNGGEFTVKQNVKALQETIDVGWQSLLLEAMRQIDENSDKVIEEKEKEKRHRIQLIHEELKSILNSRGVNFILVHNVTGFPVTSLSSNDNGKIEATELGNQLSIFLGEVKRLQHNLNASSSNFIEIQFENIVFLSCKVPNVDAWVSVLGSNDANVGFLRLELRKIVKKLSPMVL